MSATTGYFVAGSSWLHRRNPLTKLLALALVLLGSFLLPPIVLPIAAGVFGGVTGGGTDLLVALFRTLGLGVLQSALAQGLTSDPLDKTISYTVVFLILGALPVTVRTMYSRGEATVVE